MIVDGNKLIVIRDDATFLLKTRIYDGLLVSIKVARRSLVSKLVSSLQRTVLTCAIVFKIVPVHLALLPIFLYVKLDFNSY